MLHSVPVEAAAAELDAAEADVAGERDARQLRGARLADVGARGDDLARRANMSGRCASAAAGTLGTSSAAGSGTRATAAASIARSSGSPRPVSATSDFTRLLALLALLALAEQSLRGAGARQRRVGRRLEAGSSC